MINCNKFTIYDNQANGWNCTTGSTNSSSNPFSFWAKNITQSQYNDITNTGYKPTNSKYTYIQNNCASYSSWLWNKYNGKFLLTIDPNTTYITLKGSQNY